jgi:hypothetical protein
MSDLDTRKRVLEELKSSAERMHNSSNLMLDVLKNRERKKS